MNRFPSVNLYPVGYKNFIWENLNFFIVLTTINYLIFISCGFVIDKFQYVQRYEKYVYCQFHFIFGFPWNNKINKRYSVMNKVLAFVKNLFKLVNSNNFCKHFVL